MELNPQYKTTTVGIIPSDWAVERIVDVASITTGSKNTQDRIDDGAFPFFVRSQTVERINSYAFDGEGVLTAGDGVGTGKIFHYIVGKFDFHQRVYLISEFSERLNGYYFYIYFANKFFDRIMSMTAKSSVDSVRREMIANMSLPLPPIEEQRAIAMALSDANSLVASLEDLIAKKRVLKQAVMEELLTAKKRLPGFSGKWTERSLESISAFITKGATPTTYGFNWQSDGVLFLRSECVSERGLDLSQSMFISPEAHSVLKRGEVCSGDLLITITGNVGRIVRLPDEYGIANINQHIARVRITSESADRDYIFHQLSHPRYTKYFNSVVTGQAYPQISLKQVRDTVLPMPSRDEQAAIAAFLSDMDAELVTLEAERDKARAIMHGMMQELLSGRIRLK
ncbi:MAG: restriction endonuclease subunit S [Xanthobacteraceae bacterium]|nr:restriction endonuclease subunit S [Xanthobacteraceae bacterium]